MGAASRREYAALWDSDSKEACVIFKDDTDDCWFVDFKIGSYDAGPHRAIELARALNEAERR